MSLRDVPYKAAYISGVDNLVKDFYIPTLTQSTLYQRRTGYFNSRALAMAARGLSGLIKNGGKMQLLCSVQLDRAEEEVLKDPVSYIERRSMDLLKALETPLDEIEKKRLGILAEMLAQELLEIKVVWQQGGIYHEKAGIFTDKQGNIVAFNGSGNETPGGWVNNTESFHVFTSWADDRHIQPEIQTFQRLWEGKGDPRVIVVSLNKAALNGLLKFRDYYKEGLDEPIDLIDAISPTIKDWTWTPQLAYVFDAPRLWNHTEFAYGETAIQPFEHQDYVASAVLAHWPPRYLLCDEVGLGKTIEAGLIIKGFLASGRIDRLLILAPKHITKQWQRELYTKFGIELWRLDGSYVYGPQHFPDVPPPKEPIDAENPFRSKPLLIAGSELVRADHRREQVLQLEYDLVVLDEAHHARARGPNGKRTANKLLDLLEDLRDRTLGLLMLTATPIQLDRKELWDLLNIIELPGRWQDESAFDTFFSTLNAPEPDWRFLFDLAHDYLEIYGPDMKSIEELAKEFPTLNVRSIFQNMKDGKAAVASSLNKQEQNVLRLLLYRHTPIYRMVFRNSRELLKKYKAEGKFSGKIAEREPHKEQIILQGTSSDPKSERGLYERIEAYVREYYAKYNNIRQGLGFLMETYRKRLTSSMFAIKESLNRRYILLHQALETNDFGELLRGMDDDDRLDLPENVVDDFMVPADEQEDTLLAYSTNLRRLIEQEHAYLEGFLDDLTQLPSDSKAAFLDQLIQDIRRKGTNRIIIFSQFKDTVRFLLGYFLNRYGESLGSYTGDGGTYWHNNQWNECSKVAIEEKFRDDQDPLSILICTDAASEGLNLQTCDTVINYDIPWNPMRIEQRIGRVDRIGQEAPIVHIHTLFYANTVEEKVYDRCLERINYFKSALGHIQPILQTTEQIIRRASLAPTEEKAKQVLDDLSTQFDQSVAQADENLRIKELLNSYNPQLCEKAHLAPITQEELENVLSPQLITAGWTKNDEIWKLGPKAITFQLSLPDRRDVRVQAITPQSPLPQLFGNLPVIPNQINAEGITIFRIPVENYIGYIIQSTNGFFIVDHLADFTSSPARIYPSLDSAKQALLDYYADRQRKRDEAEHIAWQNRLRNWKTRCRMYLERVSAWRVQAARAEGTIASFDIDTLYAEWRRYLSDPDRSLTNQITQLINFIPDFSSVRRQRGRPSKTSPRNSKEETRLLDTYKKIQTKLSG